MLSATMKENQRNAQVGEPSRRAKCAPRGRINSLDTKGEATRILFPPRQHQGTYAAGMRANTRIAQFTPTRLFASR